MEKPSCLNVYAAMTGRVTLLVLTIVIAVAAVVATALIHSALAGIYAAALYRYASAGAAKSGFDSNVMQNAFSPK